MGKISNGILGGFSGKVGTVVGGKWKNINYMRAKAASVTNRKTEGQMNQRTKFATTLKYLQPMTEVIRVGYQNYASNMTEFNSAMSYVLNNGLTGSYPDFSIDYSKALISRGTLAGAQGVSVMAGATNSLEFSWSDNSNDSSANATDKVIVVAYLESDGDSPAEAVYVIEGAERSLGAESVTLPDNFSGKSLETFISFVSTDGKVSNSAYVGSVTAP